MDMAEGCGTPTRLGPVCPLTGRSTLPVTRATVLSHAALSDVPETDFGFCNVPSCGVVYVGRNGALIRKDALTTRVGFKEQTAPIPICYCFSFTEQQIIDDVQQHGESTIRAHIQRQVQAGRCRCELTNPAGRCCLGSVGRAIAKARQQC
jgi:hypothetical protein